MSDQMRGLTSTAVRERQQSGAGNEFRAAASRTSWAIIRTNLFSTYNIVLFVISGVLALLGRYNDAFITVIVGLLNALISTVQELRAKRQLDAIAVVANPRVSVRRDGQDQEVAPAALVRGDLIWLRSGEQAVVDGAIVDQGPVEMDESLLTGESDPVRKREGDQVLSGSFCISGAALYRAERVGAESYANALTAEAKKFKEVKTPLQRNVGYVINLIILLAVIMAAIFYLTGFIQDFSFLTNVKATAVLVGLVPYGLFLIISAAYASGAAAIARKGALVQRINAVESINSIDVLCMDKTGTLTDNNLILEDVFSLSTDTDPREALGRFVRSVGNGNRTNQAIVRGTTGVGGRPVEEVPFSSARKWSGLVFDAAENSAVLVLGAFETVADCVSSAEAQSLMSAVNPLVERGLRVLLFAAATEATTLYDEHGQPHLPPLRPLAVVALRDGLRPHVSATVQQFQALGVQLKIISGDNPRTVAAVARQAGIGAALSISGSDLARLDAREFAQAAADHDLFGRINPAQKQRLIAALMAQGHRVAMIGDGVNDVLSLKEAHLGIAMQSGTNAARNVADMVLLGDSYAALPYVLAESKRVINGIIDATYLLIGRSLIYALTIIGVMMVGLSFPFEPAQTGLTTFSVGIPAFFLMLWAEAKQSAEPLLRSIVRLVIPYTLWTMLLGVLLYSFTLTAVSTSINANDLPPGAVEQLESFTGVTYDLETDFDVVAATIVAQTTLSAFLTLVAILFLLFLAPPHPFFAGWRGLSSDRRPLWLVIILTAVLLATLGIKPVTDYFGMLRFSPPAYVTLVGAALFWLIGLRFILRGALFDRLLLPEGPPDPS